MSVAIEVKKRELSTRLGDVSYSIRNEYKTTDADDEEEEDDGTGDGGGSTEMD